MTDHDPSFSCQQDETSASLGTTKTICNLNQFKDAVSLFIYDVHCFALGIKLLLQLLLLLLLLLPLDNISLV